MAPAGAFLLLTVAIGLAGCGKPPGVESIAGSRVSSLVPDSAPAVDSTGLAADASRPASRDSALAVLERMDRTALDSAFARMRERSYIRHTRIDRLGAGGAIRASRTRTLRFTPGTDAQVLTADSTGPVQAGALSGLAPSASPNARFENPVPYALPDQPAYLSPRTREAFGYRLRADSLDPGAGSPPLPVYVLEVRALPDLGDDQSIRYARLVSTRDDRTIIAASVVRAERTLFFREDSRFSLALRPGSDDTWLPDVTRFRARVDVPFRAPRQFRTVSAFYDYGDAGSRAP